MNLHDWTRVTPGTFHDFHTSWITTLKTSLNNGRLPPTHYALAEQYGGGRQGDVLTLEVPEPEPETGTVGFEGEGGGGVATAVDVRPPRVEAVSSEMEMVAVAQRHLAIRTAEGDRLVAVVEIVSEANRHERDSRSRFCGKVLDYVQRGIHVVVVEPHPPKRSLPSGLQAEVWRTVCEEPLVGAGPMRWVTYAVNYRITAYVQSADVGLSVPDLPLFLSGDTYVDLPLAETYAEAYRGVPNRFRRVLEGPAA